MYQPLAFRIRPTSLEDVVGQDHLTNPRGMLNRFLQEKRLFSMIFFGPPGTGKTTVASILAEKLNYPLRKFNAVTGNKKDLDEIFAEARLSGQLVVIVDEVHRLNKDKQDLLLPYVEEGLVIMIGLTTANPYFSINPAIRSRCVLCEFKPIHSDAMIKAISRALTIPESGLTITIQDNALQSIVDTSNGDVRTAYNILDILNTTYPNEDITLQHLSDLHIQSNLGFDHDDDGFYDALSAFQKSIRGSDVDGALYYLARLIVAEDLDSIERRMLVTAYEDIGLANPALIARTIAAVDTARRVGFPEAVIPLGVMVIDLALSPKSKSGVNGIHAALAEVREHPLPVPPYLRLTPVGMKEEDKYDYGRPDLWNQIQYLPDGVNNLPFYKPNHTSPYENTISNNLKLLNEVKRSKNIRELKKKPPLR